MLADLEWTGEDQVSLTDPDSRAMAKMIKVGVGHDVKLAVNVKHKLETSKNHLLENSRRAVSMAYVATSRLKWRFLEVSS
jgi:hypothetical protein